ncbi:hypothetical protein BGZ60DRAFT_526397 [Tricladium varicosporioides]|nr:hypothetical protein BGZ60DRAFT_526397 [Hymenoscyphus varicosporioides]
MTPIKPFPLIPRKVKSSYSSSKYSKKGLSIIGIIVSAFLILFVITFFSSRLQAQTSTKVNIGKVSKDALFSTVTLGFTRLYQAKHFADRANTRGTVDTPTYVDEGSNLRHPPAMP